MKRFAVFLFVAVIFTYCSKDNEPIVIPDNHVYSIEIISGDNQSAKQTTELGSPVIVKVTDQNSNPVPQIELQVDVLSGGGYVMNNLLSTEDDGTLDITWQLGNELQNEILIFLTENPDVSVNAYATTTYLYTVPEQINDGWVTSSLNISAYNARYIDNAIDAIRTGIYTEIHSVLITHNGMLVLEEYFPGHNSDGELINWDRTIPHEVQSASKSFRSALIGIAIDHGFISGVDKTLFSFFPDFSYYAADGKEEITLQNVLTMTSGLQWDEWNYPYGDSRHTLSQMYSLPYSQWLGYVLGRPLEYTPGSHWVYNTGASIMLNNIIIRSIDISFSQFVYDYYAGLIESTTLPGTGAPLGGKTLPRDMAKLGQVFLTGGMWKSTRVVSENWVNESLEPRYSVDSYQNYGYQWWMKELGFGASAHEVKFASGNGGQFIMIMKDLNLVVVFTGGNFNSTEMDRTFDILSYYIIPAFE